MQYIGTILEMIITLFKGTLKGEKKAKNALSTNTLKFETCLAKDFLFFWQFFVFGLKYGLSWFFKM